MPVPSTSFWPERAHEWVALAGGVLGGILGIAGFALSTMNYRRDRAKIELNFRANVKVRAPGYEENKLYHVLQIINVGRREVQVPRADGIFYKGDGFMFADPVVRGAAVLSEKSPEATFFVEADGFNLADIWYFSVYDGARREYKIKIHPAFERYRKALANWPARRRLRHENRQRAKKKLDTYEVIAAKVDRPEKAKPSRVTVDETKAQRMQRLGPLLAAVTDVLDHVHHYRQQFSNTFDHHNMLQRKPDPALYVPLEAAAPVASTVSVKAHKHVAVAIERLKILDRLHQETGNTLKNSVSRGLTGAAAEEVKNIADQECNYLEFYLRPVQEEIQKLIDEASS